MVKKILFIDDEDELTIKIKRFLSKKGFSVTTASNGMKGIEILKKEEFPLIITDIIMPEADGFEVLKYVNARLPDSLTIILTGYDTLSSITRAVKENTYDYVIKPFDCNHLLLSINRAFDILYLKKVKSNAETQLRRLATIDEATGLFNLKCFYNVLAKEIKRANRYKKNLSLVTIDMYNLSAFVSDCSSAEAGSLLRRIGKMLKQCTRDIDSCYRFGDDKFMVLLPETDMSKAKVVVSRISDAIDNLWYDHGEGNSKKGYGFVRIGIAEYKKGHRIKDFVKRADFVLRDK